MAFYQFISSFSPSCNYFFNYFSVRQCIQGWTIWQDLCRASLQYRWGKREVQTISWWEKLAKINIKTTWVLGISTPLCRSWALHNQLAYYLAKVYLACFRKCKAFWKCKVPKHHPISVSNLQLLLWLWLKLSPSFGFARPHLTRCSSSATTCETYPTL